MPKKRKGVAKWKPFLFWSIIYVWFLFTAPLIPLFVLQLHPFLAPKIPVVEKNKNGWCIICSTTIIKTKNGYYHYYLGVTTNKEEHGVLQKKSHTNNGSKCKMGLTSFLLSLLCVFGFRVKWFLVSWNLSNGEDI